MLRCREKNNRNILVVVFFLFGVVTLAAIASREGGSRKSMTSLVFSEWVGSGDGKVSVCLIVDKTTFSASETVWVRCAIKNNTDDPLTILRPFGDPFYAYSSGLKILGPEGEVEYTGPMKEYVLGTAAFHELPGQGVIDERLELPGKYLAVLGVPGLYKMQYAYLSPRYPTKPKPANLWEGKIPTRPVYILVREQKANH